MFEGIVTNMTLSKEDYLKLLTLPIEEIDKNSRVKVIIFENKDEIYFHFARTLVDKIKKNNETNQKSRFILPVGPTPQYKIIAELTNKERINWKNVWTFNMDEYLDWQGRVIPESHPMSFKRYMYKNLFNLIDKDLAIPDKNIFFPNPKNPEKIDEMIGEIGGIDICFGGIGYHGHIAFNEPVNNYFYSVTPQEFMNSSTRIVELNSDSLVVNSICGAFGNCYGIPPKAITLGMKVILGSREIKLYCDGGDLQWQQTSFRLACMHPPTMDRPVIFIQNHDRPKETVTIYADKLTAAPIKLSPK